MIRHLPILLLFACGAAYSPPVVMPVTQPSAPITVTKPPFVTPTTPPDTAKLITFIHARAYDIREFGAKVDNVTDDIAADSSACAYCIANPSLCSEVVFPVGHTRISRPILLSNNGAYFTVKLTGVHPAKEASDQYLSSIYCDYKASFGIGIQGGRGVILENLAIFGKYTFPNSVTNKNIATLRFNDWIDPTITDTRTNPYAGICIDPLPGAGTSGVEIRQCSVKYWMVGICLSPQNTVNDEMVNIIDDDIEAVRVAIAIGQDQSKEIHIDRLKAWASVHTILDGLTYGRGTGGGSVDIEGGNFAGNINELFNLNTDRFSLSVKDVYSESIFRIGTVGKWSGANFINCQIDFLMGPGMPEPDFMLNGIGNFYGGMLRYYDNDPGHRMNFTNMNAMFRDMTLNSAPITCNMVGYPNQIYPAILFEHVNLYNMGYLMKPIYDSIIRIPSVTSANLDSINWVGSITGIGLGAMLQVNDYILGNPQVGKYYDQALNGATCPTIIIGRVSKISGDSAYLTNIALNAPEITRYNGFYISRLK